MFIAMAIGAEKCEREEERERGRGRDGVSGRKRGRKGPFGGGGGGGDGAWLPPTEDALLGAFMCVWAAPTAAAATNSTCAKPVQVSLFWLVCECKCVLCECDKWFLRVFLEADAEGVCFYEHT